MTMYRGGGYHGLTNSLARTARSSAYAWRHLWSALSWKCCYFVLGSPDDRGRILKHALGLNAGRSIVFSHRLSGVRGSGSVGSGSSLHDAFLDARGGLYIGENVIFGNEVMVLTAGHAYECGADRRRVTLAPISIGDCVWVGSRSTILAGVTIGQGAVIGAGSVVTRDVEPWSLVGGVPASFIRTVKPRLTN